MNVLSWSFNQLGEWREYVFGDKTQTGDEETDAFEFSKNRYNRMVSATLQPIEGGPIVTVSTYHMPCAFWAPKVMLIHSALAAQHAQSIAGDGALVLAGDFNFKPHDDPYKLITAGTQPDDENMPNYPEDDEWRLETGLSPMISAYATLNTKEPDFTNFAQIKDGPVFCETLDYIFLTPGVRVTAVESLPAAGSILGPLPTAEEPSDHLLLSAQIEITPLE